MVFYEFEIQGNRYLRNNCVGYYSMDFISARQSGKLTFLHTLKNNKLNVAQANLIKARCEAAFMIKSFMLAFSQMYAYKKDYYDIEGCLSRNVVVCRVPRSKTHFAESQLYFQKAIKEAIALANCDLNNRLTDSIECITRIKDVATTHLRANRQEDDIMPYPGITKDTCSISDKVRGRTILLIDDIYTLGVGVVEDCIQALYDKGAKKVIFYAVGRTKKWGNTPEKEIGGNPIIVPEELQFIDFDDEISFNLDDFKVPEIDIDDEIPF